MHEYVFFQEWFQLITICSNSMNLVIALGTLNVKIVHLLGLLYGYIFFVY